LRPEGSISPDLRNLPERVGGRFVVLFGVDRDESQTFNEEQSMSTILLVILVLLLIGALPTWPYSRGWGYYPSGGLGLIVLILLVLALSGRV
jgi:hypothetical protein